LERVQQRREEIERERAPLAVLVLAGDKLSFAVVVIMFVVMYMVVRIVGMVLIFWVRMCIFMTMRRFRQRERVCGVSLAALYDQVGKIADGGAEHHFDAAHGENGDGLLRPRHFREQEDEERLVAGRDKHGKERPERDVLPLIQL